MKNLTLLFILIPCMVFGQQKKKSPPPPEPPSLEEARAWKKHNQCFNSHKYNEEQRRAFFPFNTATTVKLISFTYGDVVYTPVAVNNFSIDYSKVRESKILSSIGIDSLTDILYNVGFTPVKRPKYKKGEVHELWIDDSRSMCIFQPRNAILFIDSTGKVTQYISICFTCHQYYLSSRKIKYTVNCENKYELLKNYFLSQGIQYGTILPKREE
ncbi:MAG TPA: hypothetical protein VK671_12195 [Mucilaginibacter sp.]|jgi:hypothetical protein|nr:hypothetical protein [Mucilaginibacter sp.]